MEHLIDRLHYEAFEATTYFRLDGIPIFFA